MRFSIIIPIYNVENYIRDCLETVVNQDFPVEEYEILVVDDCSPDSSASIVKNTMNSHPNIRLISHSENKHMGGARNTGINNAKGEWVFFLDSDDKWMTPTVLKHFDSIIKELPPSVPVIRSVSFSSLSNDGEKGKIIVTDNSITDNAKLSGKTYLTRPNMFYHVWTSCYNVAFLRNNGLYFREHIIFEDSDWSTKVMLRAPNIQLINFPFNGYRTNPNSITNLPSLKSFEDNVSSVFALHKVLEDEELGLEEKCGINARIKKSLLSFIKISRYYPRRDSLKILNRLKNTPLLNTGNYSLTSWEKLLFWLLNHCQWGLVTTVQVLTKTKRFVKR